MTSYPCSPEKWAVESLPCLGSVVTWARPGQDGEEDDWRDTAVGLSADADVATSCSQLSAFAARLDQLAAAGLSLQLRIILLRTFVNGAITHRQRARRSSREDWATYDAKVTDIMARWLGGALPEAAHVLMFMPLKRGGIGFQSAVARADAAFLASWETAAARLAADAG